MIIAKKRLITKLSLIMAFCTALNLNSFESNDVRSGLSGQLKNGVAVVFGIGAMLYNLYNRRLNAHTIETTDPLISAIDSSTDPVKTKQLIQTRVNFKALQRSNLFLRSLDRQQYEISEAIWDKFTIPDCIAVELVKEWAFPDSQLTKEEVAAKVQGPFLDFLLFVLDQPVKDQIGMNRMKFFLEQVKNFKLSDYESKQIFDKARSLKNPVISSCVQSVISPGVSCVESAIGTGVDKQTKKRVTFDPSVISKD